MLRKLNNKEVLGPSFTVTVLDIHRVVYSEKERRAQIELEGATGPDGKVNWLIYTQTLSCWDPPYESEIIPKGKRDEIINRVSAALVELDMPHQVV